MNIDRDMKRSDFLCSPMCKRTVNTDVSEDFTLPDYYPEIKKVLCVRENLAPPAKFVNGGKLDVNGVADYTVIYVSAEGSICSAPVSAEYGFSIPLEDAADYDMSEGVGILAHSVAESSNVRVLGPRKIQVRSHLGTNVNVFGKKPCFDMQSGVDGIENTSSIEQLVKETECGDVFCESSDVVTLEDEYRLSGEDARIAFAEPSVFIESCRVEGEIAKISGDVILKMLVESSDKSETVVKKMHFDADSDLDGIVVGDGGSCFANGTVTDVSVTVEEGSAFITVNLVLEVCVGQNVKVPYTCDMYSVEQNSESTGRTEVVSVMLANRNFNFSQSDRVELADTSIPSEAQIIDVLGSLCAKEAALENERYVLRGDCRYDVIYKNGEEYGAAQIAMPFKYEMDGTESVDAFDATMNIISSRCRVDGEFLSIDAEICGSCCLMGSRNITMLERVIFTEPKEKRRGVWTVCYTSPAEDLWSIAKRYGVASSAISGDPQKDNFVMIER